MRILQVNCVYNTGSTGKIVYDLHTFYKRQGIESYVCYGRGQKNNDENVFKTANNIKGLKIGCYFEKYFDCVWFLNGIEEYERER